MSASSFAMLGVLPSLGRTLMVDDDRNGARGVVLISYGLWSRRYARDPAVIGRAVNLNGETREIVGVLPASFALPNLDTEVVVPLQPDADPRRNVRNSVNFLRMVGRLKPNVTVQHAHAELEAIRQNLERQYPGAYTGKIGVTLIPLTEEIVANIKSVLLTIFCAAGAVLLVGCVNLAGISLSRAVARQRELAMRSALGRHARSSDAIAPDGKFRSRPGWWVVRHLARGVGPEGVASLGPDGPAADRKFLNRLDGLAVCRRSRICRCARVWTGARVAAFPIGLARRARIERTRVHRRRFSVPVADIACIWPDCAGAGFARERRPAVTKLCAVE
jgi:hypothetical protein